MEHIFKGKWITDAEFSRLKPVNVFHRQLEKVSVPCTKHRNRHILFRQKFTCDSSTETALVYISADDYYKLYINGKFVGQGPAPSYHFRCNYNVIDISSYIKKSENTIAVHTLYQGLINRVWQSGDCRHGLIMDVEINGITVLSSDESFKTARHSGYRETGICGYDTQFLEQYDSSSAETGFELPCYDDSSWSNAEINIYADHTLKKQQSLMLDFEEIYPAEAVTENRRVFFDFGANYAGYLNVTAQGRKGNRITVRCAQELNDDGSLKYDLRANCVYEEDWILSDGESRLDWFDYKAFRYAELIFSEDVKITEVSLTARHYPFTLKTDIRPEYAENEILKKIWELCIHTQKYGVQEVIQDCMEREKGFYLGDGCYTALTNMVLTGDDSMVKKLIDDAFSTEFITDTLVTCMDCSFMQEIAEFPLILVYLVLWHYRYKNDKEYLAVNYPKIRKLLDSYCRSYEKNGLLKELDKWCVVEWPANFRHGYDAELSEGQVCRQAHISINAYYIKAVQTANDIAQLLNEDLYRDEKPLLEAFYNAFYDKEKNLFRDSEGSEHVSLVGNSFVYGFQLCDDEKFKADFLSMLCENGISSLSLFCTFPVMWGLIKNNRYDLLKQALLDSGAWKRMLDEGATSTFEGWGKETKWNTSLFHLTMSYGALFLADIDLNKLL
ncbi:MAG: family 78 glycoside hydrolase catalytic domain [Oscillospiraceae bacterium]|nr:family 78 glycoside hydrolase catalytic domain [Oscillospiraceae bacterium]